MMAPRTKLLVTAGAVLLPASVLALVSPLAMALAVFVSGGLVLVVLVDAALATGRLEGVTATLPEITRMTESRESDIEVVLEKPPEFTRVLTVALALPKEFTSTAETLTTQLPHDAKAAHLSWPCTPLKRGRFTVAGVYLETPSPLGFWAVRAACPSQSEIRVYPSILHERKNVAALFLNRGLLGIHAQRQVGKGREFEKLREYIPGDAMEDIHWKATARRGHPVTKVYQIERTQEVYVIVDATRLSARPVASKRSPQNPTTQLERFITAAMLLGVAAERQGDLFGVMAFTDRVLHFVRAKSGKGHYSSCRDALYTLSAKTVNPDFEEVMSFIRLRLRRRALLIFLTDLDDPVIAESFSRAVQLVARHHLVLVNMITPPGLGPLFSNADVATKEDLYVELANHIQWHNLREMQSVLHKRGVTLSLLENETLCPELISQYINVKRRQVL